MTLGGRPYAVGDRSIADGLTTDPDAILAAIARVNAVLALLPPADGPAVDAARADRELRAIVGAAAPAATGGILDVAGRLVLRFLSGLRGPRVDPTALVPGVALLGIALIVFVVATLGRALPERVRREVLVPLSVHDERPDAGRHLRAADDALAAGRAREAIHALFLYVIAALAARDVLRADPALTDQELLVRAAAIPHAESLRDLVGLYERAWFGLREPSRDEALRARTLALRVAP